MNPEAYKDEYRRFGMLATLHDFAISEIEKIIYFRCLVIYVMDTPLKAGPMPDAISIRVMTREDIRFYENQPGWELPSDFVEKALGAGDECFGAYYKGQLCGYAWYAKAASTSARRLTTSFSEHYVYAYKNMTVPEHRGLGLQKWIKGYTFDYYARQGKKGIIVAIDSQNFPSRHSTEGVGARIVGYWPYMLKGDFYWGKGSKGCQSIGYSLLPAWR